MSVETRVLTYIYSRFRLLTVLMGLNWDYIWAGHRLKDYVTVYVYCDRICPFSCHLSSIIAVFPLV